MYLLIHLIMHNLIYLNHSIVDQILFDLFLVFSLYNDHH